MNRIVLTTNNQNRITARDLKANDSIQVDYQSRFTNYGYFYERKPREFDKKVDIDSSKILTNEIVAQCYLAIVLKKPSDSSRRKYKVWKDYYNQIFNYKSAVEPYLISTLIYQNVVSQLKSLNSISDKSELWEQLINSASFQISRIVSFLYHGGDYFIPSTKDKYKESISIIKKEIDETERGKNIPENIVIHAVDILEEVINSKFPSGVVNLENVLKSSDLDNYIDSELYKNFRQSNI